MMCRKTDIAVHTKHLRHLFVAVLLMLAHHLTVAGEPVDSLYHIYMNTPSSHKTEAANKFFNQLYQSQIIDTLIQFSPKDTPARIETQVHFRMAEYNNLMGKAAEALEAGNLAREAMKTVKDDRLKSDVLGTIANTLSRLGDYDQALQTLHEAYEIDKKLGDKELISSDLNTFAAIYLALQIPEHGIQNIEKAIAIERELKRPDRLAIRLGMASELYLLNNETDKAMAAIDEAYQIDKQDNRAEKAAIRLVQKAAILDKTGHADEARAIILKAIPALEKAGNNYSLAVAYNQMGSIEKQTGSKESAVAYYKKALERSIKCGSPKTERIAERGLWETLRDNDPNMAMLHLERYTALTDSLHNELLSVQTKIMDTNDLESVQTDIDKKKQSLKNLLKWGGFLLVALLVMTLTALYYALRRNTNALQLQREMQEIRAHLQTNITNQLQAPLTVVMNAGQQLLEGQKANAEENRRLGEMIVNHGQNMLGLVNQLIDIDSARAGSTEGDSKQGDIVMFVRMLVENFTEAAQQQSINLNFSSSFDTLTVVFYPDHIRKIVHILISNAIKFNDRNGYVNVKLTAPETGRISIAVADTGKGIPTNERKRIFEPFLQSVNGDDGVGTGLGLSLVKQLVQAINGTITVDSELGQGTTFTVEFPVQEAKGFSSDELDTAQQLAEKRISKASDMKHRPLVFIVENNEDVAYFIAHHLHEDYELRFARDGREALLNAQDLVPDLIITNTIMPVMDGKELIANLRDNPSLSHIAIIAMTSNTGEKERMSCIQAGADSVLVKPFNSSELRLVAAHLINQRHMLREHYVKASNETVPDDTSTQMSKEDMEFINKIVDVIHAQMANEDIDIKHIAAALSLSSKQLRTRVMSLTGLTPVAYVLQVRLNYARRLISTDGSSLATIATKCGFQNPSHFSKAFKQQFGVSPMQYRKNIGNIGQN
jgi:signal transduction histidine kinase/AraC-like DNA-binding protein